MSKNEVIYIFKFLVILILPFSTILFLVNYSFNALNIFKSNSTFVEDFSKSILVLLMMAIFSIWNQNKKPRLLKPDIEDLTKTMAIFNTILFLFISCCVMIFENYLLIKFSLKSESSIFFSNFYFNLFVLTFISLIYLFRKLKYIKQ